VVFSNDAERSAARLSKILGDGREPLNFSFNQQQQLRFFATGGRG
jgi:hypothetical protein